MISFPKRNTMWLWLLCMIPGPETQCLTKPLQVTGQGIHYLWITSVKWNTWLLNISSAQLWPESQLIILFVLDVVPAPKNLRFSQVSQTGFRAHWEHGAPDVSLYRVGWTKSGENNFQYVRHQSLNMRSASSSWNTKDWTSAVYLLSFP